MRENQTLEEIARHYGVHPMQVSRWKKEPIGGAEKVFSDKRRDRFQEIEKEALERKIGQLTLEVDFLKKTGFLSLERKRKCIDRISPISLTRQCRLLQLSRSSLYYEDQGTSKFNERLMRRIDEIHTQRPFYGWRKIWAVLRQEGNVINTKRVRRLMQEMGLQAILPRRSLSFSDRTLQKFPYLLKGLVIDRPLLVWSSDVTYIRLQVGFLFDCCNRLVQSGGVVMETVKQSGECLLHRSVRRSSSMGKTRDFQYGSRSSIQFGGFYRSCGE